MDKEARAAFIISQAACMQTEMAAMQMRNVLDNFAGRPLSHTPEDFDALPDRYGLGHNAVISYLSENF